MTFLFIKYGFFLAFFLTCFSFQQIVNNHSDYYNDILVLPLYYNSSHLYNGLYADLYLGINFDKQKFKLDFNSIVSSLICNKKFKCEQYINDVITKDGYNYISCDSNECNQLNGKCSNEKCLFIDNSIKGYYYNTIINGIYGINKASKNKLILPIGCANDENDNVSSSIHGILGLYNTNNNIVDLLYKYKYINSKKFSICVNNNTGYIIFGENNKDLLNIKKATFTFYNKYNKYCFDIYKIRFNNQYILSYTRNQLIYINTNLNYTYFPSEAYHNLINNIDRLCNTGKIYCGIIKYKNISIETDISNNMTMCYIFKDKSSLNTFITNFPYIEIAFTRYNKFYWNTYNYLFQVYKNTVCLGILENKKNTDIVFGINFMQNNKFTFNLENNIISIRQSNCTLESCFQSYDKNIIVIFKDKLLIVIKVLFYLLVAVLICMIIIILCIQNGHKCKKPEILESKPGKKFRKVYISKDTEKQNNQENI